VSENPSVIEIKALTKKYGDVTVVNNLYLDVHAAECFAILGPNGAGKSTTMSIIYGSTPATQGDAYVLGMSLKKNSKEVKARIGVVPQADGLDLEFTVLENLQLFSAYHGIDPQVSRIRIEDIMKRMGLETHTQTPIYQLSGGIRRRVAMARALVNQPDLLILDEPTVGLDPIARQWVWDFIGQLKLDKVTVLMTTHYMEEAERICDRVAIMDHGKILAIGTPDSLVREHIGQEVFEVQLKESEVLYFANRMRDLGVTYQSHQNGLNLYFKENQVPSKWFDMFAGYKSILRHANLSDVFMKLSGRDLREEPR
jgi:lipooligosaccharide transport system ATP-binding protein